MGLSRRLLAGSVAALLSPGLARAQTTPNWAYGFVPTPAQWNALWASKQDYTGTKAKGDGTTDDTLAIQAALSTGKNVFLGSGHFKTTAPLQMSTVGQRLIGAGQGQTFIEPALFSGKGVLVASLGAPGDMQVGLEGLTISAKQADNVTRGTLTAYPPLVYLDQAARCQLRDVRLCGGLDGLYLNGNCGGLKATGCNFGNFGRNIYIDGNLDVTSFTDCEVWPFSATGIMTSAQQAVFYDSSTYGLFSLRNDYLDWKGGLFLCGRNVYLGTGTRSDWPGTTYGVFSGTGFDTYGGVEVTAGNLLLGNCIYSLVGGGANLKNAVRHTGGVVMMRGGKVFLGGGTLANNAVVYSNVPTTDAMLVVENVNFELGGADVSSVLVDQASGPNLTVLVQGNKFDRIGAGAYTQSLVDLGGCSGALVGNILSPNVAATGNTDWLTIRGGIGPLKVSGNAVYNWTTTVAGATLASTRGLGPPASFGEGLPMVTVTGTTLVASLTFQLVGVPKAYQGEVKTLVFAGVLTVQSGTLGAPGNIILNGRANFVTQAGSSLTLQLDGVGNWREVGRCA